MADRTAAPGPLGATGPEPSDDPASATRDTVALTRPETTPTPEASGSTLVIEDGVIPRRLRRPLDLARFVLAVVVVGATVLVAYFATGTTAGLEEDLTGGAALLPSLAILVLNVIGGIGVVLLPVAAAIGLVVRRRVRQLFDALVALLFTVVVLTLASYLIEQYGSDQLVSALTSGPGGQASATAPIIGGLVAFVTVARLMGRRPWNVLSLVVVGSLLVVSLLSGTTTVAGLIISVFAGWGLGLLARYVFGTPTTRPSGAEVAEAMARGGFPLTMLRASRNTAIGRRYVATTRTGDNLEVVVLDRDLEGAGLANAVWKSLRLREDPGKGAFNMRRELDHAALMAYAAESAGAPVPRLLLTSEVGSDATMLAYEYTVGTRFADLTADQVTDEDLEGAWRAMRALHENQISHRSLTAEHVMRDRQGRIWLLGEASGSVAASDVALRIDTAELLCTLAIIVGADRAVRTGRKVLGVSGLSRALPALQPVALAAPIRRAMRKRRDLMVRLRDALVEIRPDGEVEQIQVERIKPRTLLIIVAGTIAAYVLLSQLAQVDLGELVTSASLEWLLFAVIASLLTYPGAAWSLTGFVPERLSLHRTVLAQTAAHFATLVSPPTLGSVAINMRFLTKAGLHPALAAASVGVAQVVAFVVYIVLLVGFGIAAGTQQDFTFDPPPWAVIAVIAVALMVLAAFAVPRVRRYVFGRMRPLLKEVVPRLITVAQRPLKLGEGLGGIMLVNIGYIAALVGCVRAFDGDTNVAAIAVVYLAGATLGQAAPTPGGLGAVEAAMAAGLTAAGLPGGIAVSSVLLFRLITFWIPTIPGYFAFGWLTKKGYL